MLQLIVNVFLLDQYLCALSQVRHKEITVLECQRRQWLLQVRHPEELQSFI